MREEMQGSVGREKKPTRKKKEKGEKVLDEGEERGVLIPFQPKTEKQERRAKKSGRMKGNISNVLRRKRGRGLEPRKAEEEEFLFREGRGRFRVEGKRTRRACARREVVGFVGKRGGKRNHGGPNKKKPPEGGGIGSAEKSTFHAPITTGRGNLPGERQKRF